MSRALKHLSVSQILELKEKKASASSKGKPIKSNVLDQEVQEIFFEQRLDHFKSSFKNESFKQRYFYTDRYINNGNGNGNNGNKNLRSAGPGPTYVFLCVGGEGEDLDKSVLIDSVHCSGDMIALASILSKQRNANVHLFALEHRYYGKSYPVFDGGASSPVTNENLVYLSSRQALADIAHFVRYTQKVYELSDDVPFITFGGSYPGVLAAWSRLKFPHLIYGAVSHSAPLQVILDFPQYLDVMAQDLSNPMVGGSQECLDIIHQGHEEIAFLLQERDKIILQGNRENIASMFDICNGAQALEDDKSKRAFLGDGVVDINVQENDPSCEGDLCNIAKICNFVVSESKSITSTSTTDTTITNNTNMKVLSKLAKVQQESSNSTCKDISWEGMMEYISSPEDGQDGGLRSWLWQTCTEMGFYQTCEFNTTCPFARGYHTLEADLEICERAFGIRPFTVAENVQETLNVFGGWDIEATNILSVNGDIDPWSVMSYSNSGRSEDGLTSYWSIGASHHFWTHKVQESDGFGIMETRDFIYNWVIELLDGKEKKGEKRAVGRDDTNSVLNGSVKQTSTE